MARAKVDAAEVSDVVLGQVLTAGQGQNPARQAAIKAGLPRETPAITINQVCGSGLRAVAMGYQAIKAGDAGIVLAGGQESMSLSTHCAYLRAGQKMGALEFVDTMIKDGLWDAFNGYHMGTTAENVAQQWQITREQQDRFAAELQRKAGEAQQAGRFRDEIVPVTVKTRKGDVVVDADEHPKPGTTAESLAKLRGAFSKDGTITAGNASGLNDGASITVLMSADEARRRGLEPLARIAAWATAGRRPGDHGDRADPGVAQGAREGRLEGRRSRPGRGQRGVRGAGLRGQPGHGLGPGQGERQRRGDRPRASDRRLGQPGSGYPAA